MKNCLFEKAKEKASSGHGLAIRGIEVFIIEKFFNILMALIQMAVFVRVQGSLFYYRI